MYLVVDGQQRITTLWEALAQAPEAGQPTIVFDMVSEKFVVRALKKTERGTMARMGDAAAPPALPMHMALDAVTLSEWVPSALPREVKLRYYEVGKRLREYLVPIYVVEGDDTEILRHVFDRTNSTGKPLTRDEVFDALVGSRIGSNGGRGLGLVHDQLRDLGFGSIDRSTILKAFEAIRGDAGRVPVGDKTRRPSASAVRAVAEVLVGGDFYDVGGARRLDLEPGPIKAFAWPLLVQAAHLAELAGSRLRLTRAGTNALSQPPAITLRAAWQRWRDTKLLDELGRIDPIKGQTGAGKRGLTAVAARRAAISDALADCPAGRWVQVDELFRYMRAAGHDFEVTREPWKLYITDPHYGSLGYQGFGDWDILQARYALCVLFEYAATLGLIDVAYVPPADARRDFHRVWGTDDLAFLSRYDGLTHVRLTALGAYCLKDAACAMEPPPEIAGSALPDEAPHLVDRGEARLFECESPAMASMIARDARMRRLCLPAGDRHVVVPAKSEAAFQRELAKLLARQRRSRA